MSLNSFKNLTNSISNSISNNIPKSMPKSMSNTENVIKNASKSVSNLKNTLMQNITIILVIFFVLLISTIFISVFNISFKEKTLVKDKAYILEGMVKEPKNIPVEPEIPESPRELAKKHYVEESCKKKDKKKLCAKNKEMEDCGDFHCCVWVNHKKGAKCEPGSATGPETFKYDKDGKLGYDHYYYKNKKYKA